ncbi:MAG: hypothetical protein GY884_05235, partial [Proteobacteria bacterium]|nr:hypothetical protein [Pseudomonadota bacterium]
MLFALALVACDRNQLGPDCPDDVEVAALEAVGSVPVVTWTTSGDTEASVGWEVADGRSGEAPSASASDHRFLLYGVPPLTDFTWTITYDQDGETLTCSGDATNEGVSDPPSVDVTLFDEDLASPEKYWLAVMPGVPSKIFVMDREGTILWNVVLGDDQVSADIRFARNGDILYNYFAESHYKDAGSVVRIGLDGEIAAELKTPLAHHVFTEREDGTLAYLAIDLRSWDPFGDIVGDAVYETT